MELAVVDAVTLPGSREAADLSIMNLFWRAHWVVKAVMVALLAASVWSWAIIIEKFWRMQNLERRALKFEDAFWSGSSLDELYERMGQPPMIQWQQFSHLPCANGAELYLRERLSR